MTNQPTFKEGDYRVRQTDEKVFIIEKYSKDWSSRQYIKVDGIYENVYSYKWENVQPPSSYPIYKKDEYGQTIHHNYDGFNTFRRPVIDRYETVVGLTFTNLLDASQWINDKVKEIQDAKDKEQFRKDNYSNVFYPTEFNKEKFNEPK